MSDRGPDRHAAIAVAALAVMASLFAYSAWNIANMQNLEIRASEHGRFGFFGMGNGGAVTLCNPAPFFTSLDRLDVTVFYRGDPVGTYTALPGTLHPSSSAVLYGAFRSESYSESQYVLLYMDAEFGGAGQAMLDPDHMSVNVDIHAPVIGVVPYAVTDRYHAGDFYDMMNSDDGC